MTVYQREGNSLYLLHYVYQDNEVEHLLFKKKSLANVNIISMVFGVCLQRVFNASITIQELQNVVSQYSQFFYSLSLCNET